MEKVVNVDDLSVEDLMKLIEQKKLSKKQKITCNDLDNLLIKRKPFIESDPSQVYFNHIATSVSSTSFKLSDHNYVTVRYTYYIGIDQLELVIINLSTEYTQIESPRSKFNHL